MTEIDSREKLEAWLKDKPAMWTASIALRIAFRVLPYVCNPVYYSDTASLLKLAAATFRCTASSLIAGNFQTHNNNVAAYAAADVHAADDTSAQEPAIYAAYAADYAAYAAARSIDTENPAYSNLGVAIRAAESAVYCVSYSVSVDAEIYTDRSADTWIALSHDCDFLDALEGEPVRALMLFPKPLWPSRQPDWFVTAWLIARETLSNTNQGFEIWINWFQRRIDGKATGFDLPPDADAEISRRLIAASNDWWEREPAEVNADIKSWLTELTPPPAEPNEADFTQNPRALTFGADADGRIGLAPDLAANRLLDDTDAQDRHAEVLREAQALQGASQHGQTQATDLDQPTLDFIAALGESLAKTKPSWLVARGEKLRRMRGQRQNGTSLAPPLSERQAEAIDALITALDIMVGLDPYLLSIRQASYDPDMPRGTGDPVAIRLVIDHALAIKVARADAHDALADAVANVPADAAPDDRRRLTLWADFKNFIQATGRFIWKHKGKVTTGVVAAITLIQLNAATLKGIFVASPTMLEIIRWIELIKLPS